VSGPDDLGLATLAIRTGHHRTPEGEHAEPIFTTSSYVFASAREAAARFAGEDPGNIYSRFTNPTVSAFEERLAALEGGECCVATASGMSAILSLCLGLLKAREHIVSSRSIFGSTTILFSKYLTRFGIETSYVPLADLDAWESAIGPVTRLLFVETPSNPLTEMVDIRALADLVMHSATKYLDGQGRCVGGAVVGDRKLVGEEVFGVLRTAGPTMSPFNAWVFLKGLETLELRMLAHSQNALILARWLQGQAGIAAVYYPGLDSHPQSHLVGVQQRTGGGVVAFEVHGGREGAWRFIDSTRMLSITANLGDTKTTITHPATTTHGRLTDEERETARIGEGLIRVAVGLEDIEDIKADLTRGLAAL